MWKLFDNQNLELNSDDDEDDDDLAPIESNIPLSPNKPIYIRDFLEGLPESKTYDDTKGLFSELPRIVRNQVSSWKILF